MMPTYDQFSSNPIEKSDVFDKNKPNHLVEKVHFVDEKIPI